jgi:hypothetical protein
VNGPVDHDAGRASAFRESQTFVDVLQDAVGFACMFAPSGFLLLLTLLSAFLRSEVDHDQNENTDNQEQQASVTPSE